jgi:hypothetical protein
MRRLVVCLVVGGATLAAAVPATASAPTWHSTTLAAPAFPGFVGVGASSASDVWAVGENDADRETPYAQHWTGSSWASIAVPLPGPTSDVLDGGLFGVSSLSPKDAWAVGWHDTGNFSQSEPMAQHWNGSAWRVTTTPRVAPQSFLTDVATVARRNIWAVGGTPSGPLVEHRNGTAWRHVTTPGSGQLAGVKAISASDVWAVGQDEILHYNGTAWSSVSFPGADPNVFINQVNRVPGTTHLWAVGWDATTSTPAPVALYYNGSAWTSRTPPAGGRLYGVAARSETDVWAAGSRPNGGAYVVHWNGSTWSVATGVAVDAAQVSHMTKTPGSPVLWAVGNAVSSGNLFAAYYR